MIFRYSTISDWYKCQRFFKHKHLDGLPDPSMNNNGDLSFGTAIHLAVQDLFEGGDGLDIFHAWWELEGRKPMTYGKLGHDALASLGAQLITVFRDEHMAKFQAHHLEKKLAAALGEHDYSGTADFVGLYKGVPSVVDWKTSATPYSRYKIEVNEQMYGYAYLVEQKLGFAAQQIVYGVAVKDPRNPRWQFRTAPISPASVIKKLDNVKQACDAVKTAEQTGRFARNPLQCVTGSYGNERVCPYYALCHGGEKQDVSSGEEGKEAGVAELCNSGAKESK